MSGVGRIVRVEPERAIPGGEVILHVADLSVEGIRSCRVWFDDAQGQVLGASPQRLLAIIPETGASGAVEVMLECDGQPTETAMLTVAMRIASDLHMVANPAFDPDDGSLYLTRSGSRGQQFPVTLFRLDTDMKLSDFSGDIPNPTGIAFDRSGQMFVTSRFDGNVYRITPFKEAVAFAKNLGVATGIAFDSEGRMYVGDRTGTIYRVNAIGEERPFAQLEPSVSAYHLAFGPDDALYVTGPTVSSSEAVMRVDRNGEASVFYKGLGRPHGLAFDRDGNLYVAASLRGRRGIVRITSDGRDAELFVAGMNVVGLAFGPAGEMVVVTSEAVFTMPLNIRGTLL